MDELDTGLVLANNQVTSMMMINPRNKVSTVKLNNDNFLLWKFQVGFLLEGHGFWEKHVCWQAEAAPKFLQVSEKADEYISKIKKCIDALTAVDKYIFLNRSSYPIYIVWFGSWIWVNNGLCYYC